MMPGRLAYVVNARLPTEKAHGLQIAKMCEAFAGLGCEVTVYSPRRRQADRALEGAKFAEFYHLREPVKHVRLSNTDVVALERYLPTAVFKAVYVTHALLWSLYAANHLRQSSFDVVVARDPPTAFCLAALGFPVVFEAHTLPRRAQLRLLRAIPKTKGLRATVALTSFMRRDLLELGFPPETTITLADGVDLELLGNVPDRGTCRQLLGLPLERPLVGYVGSFEAVGCDKGLRVLLEAVARLRAERFQPLPALVLVGGSAAQLDEYASKAVRLGLSGDDVHLPGRVPYAAVPTWIRACDILTIPSPATGHLTLHSSPLKLFEYLASGTAIVSSDLPSIREVLRDGQDALLVPPGDSESWSTAMRSLLSDRALAQRLRVASLSRARDYSWVSRARRLLDASDRFHGLVQDWRARGSVGPTQEAAE